MGAANSVIFDRYRRVDGPDDIPRPLDFDRHGRPGPICSGCPLRAWLGDGKPRQSSLSILDVDDCASALMIVFQCNVFSLNATTHWGLAWAVDDWQLHSRALNETGAWLSGRRPPLALTPRERFWFRFYGLCSLTLRIVIDLVLFFGGGYFFTHLFGGPGLVAFLFMAGWWNRDHLKVVWRWAGCTPFEAWRYFSQWRSRRVEQTSALLNDADVTPIR